MTSVQEPVDSGISSGLERRSRHVAALAAALCLAGCGSDSKRDVAPAPTLPRELAVALADRSDEVARALDTGDECRALAVAEQLRQETIAAINTGRVPSVFQETLLDRANGLPARIRCLPPPVVDEPDKEDEDKGKRGHGKGKKGHEGEG
jgi:hypothetical protein